MVCDPHRGLPLELSITKLLFSRYADRIQLIGMSATMGGEQVSCHAQEACPLASSVMPCPGPCCPAHACPALSLPSLLLPPALPWPAVTFLILPCPALQCPDVPRPVLPCPGRLVLLLIAQAMRGSLGNPRPTGSDAGLQELRSWMQAELFLTNFRPVPLTEHAVFKGCVYSKVCSVIKRQLFTQGELPWSVD